MEEQKTRIFKNKWFFRFARKEGFNDPDLCEAIRNAEQGLIDTDLGGGVIKQRRGNQADTGQLSCFAQATEHSSCMVSRRVNEITLTRTSWQASRRWRI